MKIHLCGGKYFFKAGSAVVYTYMCGIATRRNIQPVFAFNSPELCKKCVIALNTKFRYAQILNKVS